ncbi:hypothetical protein E8E13_007217 [Curvularia kusanoi]|uniref:Uncharacterized protein n=1 Tax=Curvularia kusanoi TaxID=90978 RepID=A0A9P4TGL5_CURKU|nr:hypothetical protein E8E13_007217 [Curvularia kusanoi]
MTTDPNELTARESEVLALAWQCMESDPKIDFTKLAQLANYTPASASVIFGKIKRKLKAKATGVSTAPATPKKSKSARQPRTPASAKRAAASDAADGTPSKKSKKAKKPASDDEDEEFGNFTVKREEITDINEGADAFFKEAGEYAQI